MRVGLSVARKLCVHSGLGNDARRFGVTHRPKDVVYAGSQSVAGGCMRSAIAAGEVHNKLMGVRITRKRPPDSLEIRAVARNGAPHSRVRIWLATHALAKRYSVNTDQISQKPM